MKRKGLSAPLVIVLLASQFILMALAVPAASYDDDLTAEYSVTTIDRYANPNWSFNPPFGANNVYPKTKYWLQDQNAWTENFIGTTIQSGISISVSRAQVIMA